MERLQLNNIYQGNTLDVLKTFPDESINCVVTSPPYWNLRDYGVKGQLGLESTPEEYTEKLVKIFREVRRVLRDDGTLWLNLGDSYASQPAGNKQPSGFSQTRPSRRKHGKGTETVALPKKQFSCKLKDLVGIPWRVAFALQADGWYLRSDIIWHKPNPMPESVTDRPTKAHEYIFLLSKNKKYYYDAESIMEIATGYDGRKDTMYKGGHKDMAGGKHERCPKKINVPSGWDTKKGGHGTIHREGRTQSPEYKNLQENGQQNHSFHRSRAKGNSDKEYLARNKRSVWTVSTKPYKEAHFAVYPPELIVPCIKAGCPKEVCSVCKKPYHIITEKELAPTKKAAKTFVVDNRDLTADKNDQGSNRQKDGHKSGYATRIISITHVPDCECNAEPVSGVVLDPFFGSGTTGEVSQRLGRKWVGIELNPDYVKLANKRFQQGDVFAQ